MHACLRVPDCWTWSPLRGSRHLIVTGIRILVCEKITYFYLPYVVQEYSLLLRAPSAAVPQRAVPLICRTPDLIHSPLLPLHFSMPPLSSHSPSPATAPMVKPRGPGAITCSASCSTVHGTALPSIEAPAPVTSAQDCQSPPQMISNLEVCDDQGNLRSRLPPHSSLLRDSGARTNLTYGNNKISIDAFAWACDATNVNVWDSKVRGLCLNSYFIHDVAMLLKESPLSCVSSRIAWADIARVGCAKAKGAHALIEKQAGYLGCLLWTPSAWPPVMHISPDSIDLIKM
jgi:hypothetical protein